jgi:CubicO group peptidase (beta-lactamase class C family)
MPRKATTFEPSKHGITRKRSVTMRLWSLAAILLAACGTREAPAPTGLETDLARISREFFEANHLPGLAVGVIAGDRVAYRAGFGSTRLEGGQPVTPSTLFHMASVTKPFVATAVMQLVDAGKVNLDSLVSRYLPYFRMKDPRSPVISVRQVLTHTAGLPDVTDYRWGAPEYDDGALERYVRGLADSGLIAPPGDRWAYSNIGFEILADLVAKVAGQSFEDYVQARILRPLGMSQSTLLMTDVDSTLLAWGHEADSTGSFRPTAAYPYNRRHAGSSTLHANVDDMLRWAMANLHRGTLDGGRILDSAAYDRLWEAQRDITPEVKARASRAGIELPYDRLAIGLSWFLTNRRGRWLVNHSGGDLGFRSDLLLDPEARAAVVVMTNSGGDMRKLSTALLDAVHASLEIAGRRGS